MEGARSPLRGGEVNRLPCTGSAENQTGFPIGQNTTFCRERQPLLVPKGLTTQADLIILNIERALPVDGWPLVYGKEVTACFEAGRLLLFMYLNEQTHNADDDQTKLKQL